MLHFDLMFNQLEWPVMGFNPYPQGFLYGYLRSRGAVILSLVRNALDIFLSEKTLQVSSTAHVPDYADSRKSPCDIAAERLEGRRVRLDPAEYASFAEAVSIHRQALRHAFSGYRFFADVNYESLASARAMDATAVDVIRDAAKHQGITERHDGGLATFSTPVRVPPAYDRLFENLDELRDMDRDPVVPCA
jgi:hypothetical protein